MPKSSSSLSPTIIPMNPNPNCASSLLKTLPLNLPPPCADDFLRSFDDDEDEPEALIESDNPFNSLLEEPGHALIGDQKPFNSRNLSVVPYIDPTPHISSQFYTFNKESHSLMIKCILQGRLASPEEIKLATPQSVLGSWRNVWKDRNEDTAYLTAWKRIQDKLNASDSEPTPSLFFKTNSTQRVSHVDQWRDIVVSCHADPDQLRHLTLKDTLDRIKQSWTVGAKFYGIPESFVRLCLASCPVCNSPDPVHNESSSARNKRRRFEYTETLDVPAKDVPFRLQQLAAKYKVVLCIRQKYIRYKPFMAEVKDYACHRAGEPSASGSVQTGTGTGTKKGRVVKREPYQSKRCGCGFRIRAIVPIANYNEKDKTFVYQEEGTAVFKLYAVHSGHEPGPLDGSARIVHRLVGHKGSVGLDPEIYGLEDGEPGFLSGAGDSNSSRQLALSQIQEIKGEVGNLESKITKMPPEVAGLLVRELSEILHRVRKLGLEESLFQQQEQEQGEHLMLPDDVVTPWTGGGGAHLMEDEDDDYGSGMVQWEGIVGPSSSNNGPMMKEDFDEKLEGFYHGTKWYESPPHGLDPGPDHIGFRD